VHISNDDVSIAYNVTSLGAMDLISTALAPCHQKVVNDDGTVLTVTEGMFAQLCLDLNNKVNDPDALLAKFKAARAVGATAEANNGTCVYDVFTSLIAHHLSFHAMQEMNTTVYNDIIGLYVQYSDEVHSNRVQNISNDLSFDKALRLGATSHAIVRTIQNTRVDCLLRVLFDSGADRMMMKHLALPPGVNPLLGQKHPVTGVTASALLDKEVHIEYMILFLSFLQPPAFGTKTCHHHG
jgi:hypothetical protein